MSKINTGNFASIRNKSMSKHHFKRSYNRNSSVVFVLLILALSLVLVVIIFTHSPYLTNAQVQNITKKGTFNYTQSDTSGNPDWTDTGNWSFKESPSVVLTFDAVINMAKPNGSEGHQHTVSDLTIPYAPFNQTNSTVIKGTTTLTMDKGTFVSEEPTTITLGEKNISVYFDPAKIKNHFGNQSIIGVVTQ
ncbi:hypothetical protein [Candidatus Nitrosocosmicus sp. SS]|uniref:hypothetical protein n=1 Tax=Candidatus Nitrosocosmicus agrestis TaxID=2563600 RepID=UPI00122DE81E|nr:hypothetical protein [Candidatus Nitrosocosmicus sp. SS]KAA2283111.1 hypothetical protein F1Z66_03265 [Candidatus Nitrosocosmicus sp. SS]KAF0868567.1 hypothetical protein E5N71_09295 [Candidatus Nitrosocosmicus sp. SS]